MNTPCKVIDRLSFYIDFQQSFEIFWRIIERLKANPSPVAQVDAAISCLMAWQVIDQGLDQGKCCGISFSFFDDAYHDDQLFLKVQSNP